MINPQGIIESPCHMDWNSMATGKESDKRFCAVCTRSVFDISDKNDKEIMQLFNDEGTDICVKSLSHQLTNQHKKASPLKASWRKGKFIGLILIAGLISTELSAQQKKKEPNSYHIVQNLPDSDTIIIKGVIKGERWIGWKKIKNANIDIWSEEHINLGSFKSQKNGQFEFALDKRLIGENFSISISIQGYKRIQVNHLESKNTELKVFLEEQETTILTGRFF